MLWQINGAYFLCIALFSVLYPGQGGWWLVPLFMFFMGSALYWVHRLGHTLVWRLWFEAHVTGHHLQQYPGKSFSNPVYRQNTLDKYHLNSWTYAAAALLVLFIFQRWSRPPNIALLYLTALTALFLAAEERLHHYVHTTKDAPYPWLTYIREMHHRHHTGSMKRNYAVLSLWLDWLYGSLD